MNRIGRLTSILCLLSVCALALTGCMAKQSAKGSVPEIPEKLGRNQDGVPMLKVYDVETHELEEMDIESYVMGVVAGEMRNNWPVEALKAQAILARSYTMKFLAERTSAYDGADISTDVKEAQAYDADAVNDRVRQAVNDTRGIVMSYDGDFVYAWFHAHAGGKTELPTRALEYNSDPAYLSVVASPDSDKAPDEVKHWSVSFTREQVQTACADAGVQTGAVESVALGDKGESGRAITLVVNGKSVSAPSFRLAIGASKLKSTLIDAVEISGDSVKFSGSGFGHGVGMSQWGAYALAEDGKNAEQIVGHYYKDIDLMELW